MQATNFSAPPPHLQALVQPEQGEGLPASSGLETPENYLLSSPPEPTGYLQPWTPAPLPPSVRPILALRKPWVLPSGVSSPLTWPPSVSRLSRLFPLPNIITSLATMLPGKPGPPSPWACIIHANPCFLLLLLPPRPPPTSCLPFPH